MNVQVYLRLDHMLVDQPDIDLPVLQQLLAKGSVTGSTQAFEAALCQGFGVEKQLDWPTAALAWLGEGNDPAGGFWLHADPVNLQLQRDHFTLNAPVPLPLTETESNALLATLNGHFSEDGFVFHAAASGRWYLQVANASAISTSFPGEAVGRDIRGFLPAGAAAEHWRGVFNEIQMLLHEHPVNRAREETDILPVNSLWFSGSGTMPSSVHPPSNTVVADDPLTKGLALRAGRTIFPLAGDLELPDEDVVLVLGGGRDNLVQWLSHIMAGLRSRNIRRLDMNLFVHDRHAHVALRSGDLWKFWRKPQPLAAYFS
jgi:hypothetical protein